MEKNLYLVQYRTRDAVRTMLVIAEGRSEAMHKVDMVDPEIVPGTLTCVRDDGEAPWLLREEVLIQRCAC